MRLKKHVRSVASQAAAIFLLSKSTRNDILIELQYDKGIWENDLHRITQAKSLEEYLFPKDSNLILRRAGNYSAGLMTNEKYLRAKAALLMKTFENREEICEIGCGAGWNLLALRYMGFRGKLAGIDISKNGLKTIDLASHRWGLDIQTCFGDMRSNEIFQSPPINSATTLFTYLALEQLPDDAEIVLRHLDRYARQKEVILLESSRELFPLHYSEFLSKIYTLKRDYLRCIGLYMRKNDIEYRVDRVKFSHRIGNEIAIYRLGS
jgi:hypothetical protein